MHLLSAVFLSLVLYLLPFFIIFFFQVPALALSSLCFQLYLAFLDFQHRIYVLRTYVPFQRTLAQPLLASEYSTLCGFFPFRLLA